MKVFNLIVVVLTLMMNWDQNTISFYYQKMLKAKGRNFDNVSIAQTKSSKTLKSKVNHNPEVEVNTFDPPYFKKENFYREIEERAKKENTRFSGLVVKTNNYNHLDRAHQIVKDLLQRHHLAKQKLGKLKEENQKQTKIDCPFQPNRKKLEKFVVGSDVIRRNENWLMEKRRISLLRQEENLEKDLAKCTFSPQISKNTRDINKRRQNSQSLLVPPRLSTTPSFSPSPAPPFTPSPAASYSPLPNKACSHSRQKDLSRTSFETAKREINNRLLAMNSIT